MDAQCSYPTYGAALGTAPAAISAALQFLASAACLLQEPWPPQAHVANGSTFDFIVVGGGTAGATLASRLSEVDGFSVAALEAGGDPPLESILCFTYPPVLGTAPAAISAALQFLASAACLLQEPWTPQAHVANGSTFDFIVVGGGTAGATLASRLSEVDGFSVAALEAGGDPPLESIIPGYKNALHKTKYDWNYTSVDDGYSAQALPGRRQFHAAGRMLGGSGSYNSMIYARGLPADYDRWAAYLGPAWGWDNALKYFKKTENLTDARLRNNPEVRKKHGFHGEMHVTGIDKLSFDAERFSDAFKFKGIAEVEDLSDMTKIGIARMLFTISEGRRDSSAAALLTKVGKRKNLSVVKHALVTKVLIKDNKAYGVQVLLDGEEVEYYARKEVILSAGVYSTPKILQLSGIGPKDHLEALDIDVIQDLPVGDNFQDHIQAFTYIAAEPGTCASYDTSGHLEVLKYLYNRTGSLSVPSRIAVNLATNGSLPDVTLYPSCKAVGAYTSTDCAFSEQICNQLYEANKKYELMEIFAVLVQPKSRGKIRLQSKNPLDAPLIYTGYFNANEDLEMFPPILDLVKSVADTPYFKTKKAFVIEFEVDECRELSGVERQKCVVLATALTDNHGVGTARAGSVLDAQLRVRGVAALRVVDASALPSVPRANLNSPTVMLAERAADIIKNVFKNDCQSDAESNI